MFEFLDKNPEDVTLDWQRVMDIFLTTQINGENNWQNSCYQMLVILNAELLSSNHFLCPLQTYIIYMILLRNMQKQKILTTEKPKLENVWLRI